MKAIQSSTANLQLLAVFKAVVECGGFAPAQVLLNSSQPTISNQMAALEAKLGLRLCERGRAGFRITEHGQAVYESLQSLFAAHESFNKHVATLTGVVAGDLHVGVIDNTATDFESPLVPALRLFRDRGNDVHVHLHVVSPLELEQRVIDRRVEVGLGCFPSHAPSLVYRRLFLEHHQLYCGSDHPLFQGITALPLSDLVKYEFVHRGYFSLNHATVPNGAPVTATVTTMEAVAMLVLTGRYLGYLPTHYAEYWVRLGKMRAMKLDEPVDYSATFEMVYRRGVTLSLAARAFIADLNTVSRSVPTAG